MKTPITLLEVATHLAMAKAGADKFSYDMRYRACQKLLKARQLPRKAKKRMKKDAMLDLQFAQWNDSFSADNFEITW